MSGIPLAHPSQSGVLAFGVARRHTFFSFTISGFVIRFSEAETQALIYHLLLGHDKS
jgi:hypothetical protein